MERYTKENPLRVVTTFSGYDSQCLALERMKEIHPEFDYELIGWSEIDKYAIAGHDQLFPQWADRNLGDISKVDWESVPDFDFFTFSSPYQDFSNAGLQRGGTKGSGTRSSLLWECEKAFIAKRPKYMFMENVAALVSTKFFNTFSDWCHTVEALGYKVFYDLLNAKDFGVPQNRLRVFVVFIREDVYEDCSAWSGTGYIFPRPFPLEKRLKDVLEQQVGDKYYLSETSVEGFLAHNERHEEKGTGFI